jgi:hypothetical protein
VSPLALSTEQFATRSRRRRQCHRGDGKPHCPASYLRLPLFIVLSLLSAPRFAEAQEQPLLLPTRDVILEQRMDDPIPTTQVVSYLASEGKMRTDTKGNSNYIVIDFKEKVITIVNLGEPATYTEQPLTPFDDPQYKKGGRSVVAGLECTLWQDDFKISKDPIGRELRMRTTMCITDDGVPLQTIIEQVIEGNRQQILVEATTVRYAPQDPALFRPPTGAIRQ